MKQKESWRDKLDDWALELIEGYRKASALRGKLDSNALQQKIAEISAEHPQLRSLGNVDVLPEFLDLLRNSESMASLISQWDPTPGSKTMGAPAARFVEVMQTVTQALEDPEMRIAAGLVAAFAALLLGNTFEGISKSYFGDAGPKEAKDFLWVIGKMLELWGKTLRTGKVPNIKGRVNVELIELIKELRQHQKARLTYRELHQALEYAGVHVQDEETLRVFEFRARKKGWIKSHQRPPKN